MTTRTVLRFANTVQTLGLLAILVLQTGLVGYLVAGPLGAGIALAMGAMFAGGASQMPGWAALRVLRARPVQPWQAPWLVQVVTALSRRAGLPRVPQLALVDSADLNAVTVGSADAPAIAVTRGLLRDLSERELIGVLAHEIGHIAHRDLRTLALAQAFATVTGRLGPIGLFLTPLGLLGGSLQVVGIGVVLLAGPVLAQLLTLAVSRQREFAADDLAVELTGDPAALAHALQRIEATGRQRLGPLVAEAPAWLRSHPATTDRIQRLAMA